MCCCAGRHSMCTPFVRAFSTACPSSINNTGWAGEIFARKKLNHFEIQPLVIQSSSLHCSERQCQEQLPPSSGQASSFWGIHEAWEDNPRGWYTWQNVCILPLSAEVTDQTFWHPTAVNTFPGFWATDTLVSSVLKICIGFARMSSRAKTAPNYPKKILNDCFICASSTSVWNSLCRTWG